MELLAFLRTEVIPFNVEQEYLSKDKLSTLASMVKGIRSKHARFITFITYSIHKNV